MVSKSLLFGVLGCIVVGGISGCERVSEPWVENPQQLERERTRTDEAVQDLRNRLMAVQTDR